MLLRPNEFSKIPYVIRDKQWFGSAGALVYVVTWLRGLFEADAVLILFLILDFSAPV